MIKTILSGSTSPSFYMIEIWKTVLKDTPKLAAERKDFRLPVIVPCVLYNGENNWTVKPDFKDYLAGSEEFGRHALNFRYILIDVNRYTDEYLLELSNLIGSIFMLDKKMPSADDTAKKLIKLISVLKKLDAGEFILFKNWLANRISKTLPQDEKEKIESILSEEKEVEMMVYAIEKVMKEESERQREAGLQEGIDKEAENSRQRNINSAKKLLTKKFGSLSAEVIGKLESAGADGLLQIIDNIFDLETLDDALKFL